jgi:integrase
MAGLRRKRLDLAAGVVEVAEVVTEMHGHLYLGPPKTTAGRRRVGLPRVVVEALQDHLAGRSVEPDGFVFALSNGGPLRTASFRTRVWRPATRAAGLEGCASMIAAYGGALWIAAGAGPKEVATRAGHTSVSFTLRPAMQSRPRRGPGRNERRRPQDRDALTCWVGWRACQDLNLGPHPEWKCCEARCRAGCMVRTPGSVPG